MPSLLPPSVTYWLIRLPSSANHAARRLLYIALLGLLGGWLLIAHTLPSRAERGLARSIRFDGEGAHLAVEADDRLSPVGAMTIELWIKPDGTLPTCQTLVAKGADRGGYWLGLCHNILRFQPAGPATAHTGSSTVFAGRWTHVAVTYDGRTLRFYLDGVLHDEFDAPGYIGTNDSDLTLGAQVDQSQGYKGQMAEVRLWRSARSTAEIREHMIFSLAADDPDLIGAWSLDGHHADAFGHFTTTPARSPTYTDSNDSPSAPVQGSAPLAIPRLPDPVTVDGRCATDFITDEYEYAMRLPLWYVDQNGSDRFTWAYLGGDTGAIYLCAQIESQDFHQDSAGSVYLLPAAATAPLHIRATTNSQQVQRLDPGRGYQDISLDPALYEAVYSGFSQDRTVEVKLDHRLLGQGDFALQLVHTVTPGDATTTFPLLDETFATTDPATWPRFVLDDSTTGVPRSDTAQPRITFTLSPTAAARAGSPLVLEAEATDDVDLARIDIRSGTGALIHTCTLDGADDTAATCQQTVSYPAGRYVFYAEAVDHRGRYARSAARPFFYYLDSAAPQLFTAALPSRPSRGDPVPLTVTGHDPSGIRHLRVEAYVGPRRFVATCNGDEPAQTELTCTLTLDTGAATEAIFSFEATATNFEAHTTSTGQRFARLREPAAGQAPTDQDHDGLPDSFENRFCTDPANPDSDGDGLPDGWELLGIDFANGDRIDLPELGAHPCRRDLFLQLDYSAGRDMGRTYRQRLVNDYARHGYTLHLTGREHPTPPHGQLSPMAQVAAASQDAAGDYYFAPRLNWTHRYGFIRDVPAATGGSAQNHYFSAWAAQGEPAMTYQMVFHQLGHTLGLGHGGRRDKGKQIQGDQGLIDYQGVRLDANRGPNYLSSMNGVYLYSGGSICFNPAAKRWLADGGLLAHDMPTLQENALDERASSPFAEALAAHPCGSAEPGYLPTVLFSCEHPTDQYPDGSPMRYAVLSTQLGMVARKNLHSGSWQIANLPGQIDSGMGSGIDWNCDGVVEPGVSAAIDERIPQDACDGQDDDRDCGRSWRADQTFEATADWDKLSPGRACTLVAATQPAWQQPAAYRSLVGGPTCADKPIAADDEAALDAALWNLPNLEFCNGMDDDGNGILDDGCADGDGDGVADAVDNCPHTPNADQGDADGNWIGDACQTPLIHNLTMAAQGGQAVQLSWEVGSASSTAIDHGDLLGFVIYRQAGPSGELYYVGDSYPTTTAAHYEDVLVGAAQTAPLRYLVYPLNRAGAHGMGASVGELPEVPEEPEAPGLQYLPLLQTER